MKRIVGIFILVFALLPLTVIRVSATDAAEREYDGFISDLPGSAAKNLPDGITDAAETAAALTDWRHLLGAVGDIIGQGMTEVIPMLLRVCGLLLLVSVMSVAKSTIASPETGKIISFCTTCAVAAAVVTMQYKILIRAETYLAELSVMVNALLPLNVTLYAAGGNTAGAAVSGTALTVFLNFTENILAKSVIPFAAVGSALAVSSAIPSGVSLKGLFSAIKKCYTLIITFTASLLCAVLGAQNALASATDGISLRAAKFVAGSAIPVVGGSVGESMKTLAAGLTVLRKSVGITGIVLLCLMFLPTLITFLSARLAFSFAAAFAEMLGCEGERNLLSGLSEIYGCVAAVLSVCTLTFIFSLVLLTSAAVPM